MEKIITRDLTFASLSVLLNVKQVWKRRKGENRRKEEKERENEGRGGLNIHKFVSVVFSVKEQERKKIYMIECKKGTKRKIKMKRGNE